MFTARQGEGDTVGDDWHEYFEDFPEEDPANYWSNGQFELGAAQKERELMAKQAAEQAALDHQISRMIAEGAERARAKKRSSE